MQERRKHKEKQQHRPETLSPPSTAASLRLLNRNGDADVSTTVPASRLPELREKIPAYTTKRLPGLNLLPSEAKAMMRAKASKTASLAPVNTNTETATTTTTVNNSSGNNNENIIIDKNNLDSSNCSNGNDQTTEDGWSKGTSEIGRQKQRQNLAAASVVT
ncbi:unnamed protein product, partial [Sphacelaria rigidula]